LLFPLFAPLPPLLRQLSHKRGERSYHFFLQIIRHSFCTTSPSRLCGFRCARARDNQLGESTTIYNYVKRMTSLLLFFFLTGTVDAIVATSTISIRSETVTFSQHGCTHTTAIAVLERSSFARDARAAFEAGTVPRCSDITASAHWCRITADPPRGFHRRLNTTVFFASPAAVIDCIPRGAFVDIYQFRLAQIDAVVSTEQDLECPVWATQALPTILVTRPNASVPIHMRYHRAATSPTRAKVTVPSPFVVVACTVAAASANNSSGDASLLWVSLPRPEPNCSGPLVAFIPVGDASCKGIVSAITFTSTSIGALAVVFAVRLWL